MEMRLGASFVSAEEERVVEIVELDRSLPRLLSAEALRRGRGVVFLVLTGVFLKVWDGVFLRSLSTMRPPMLLRRRPARCGVVLATAGIVCLSRVRVSRYKYARAAAQSAVVVLCSTAVNAAQRVPRADERPAPAPHALGASLRAPNL